MPFRHWAQNCARFVCFSLNCLIQRETTGRGRVFSRALDSATAGTWNLQWQTQLSTTERFWCHWVCYQDVITDDNKPETHPRRTAAAEEGQVAIHLKYRHIPEIASVHLWYIGHLLPVIARYLKIILRVNFTMCYVLNISVAHVTSLHC